MTDVTEHEEIQKRGANARARGEYQGSNPYYASSAMPAATGETAEEWNAKAIAWQLGWTIEDAMRGDR